MEYDLIVVGGGMAGSTLARRMASGGARVLVLERETQFRDRVRGESLQPWGVAEAQQLGIAELLRPYAAELRWFEQIVNGQHTIKRDLMATTLCATAMWGFYHPEAQEILLAAAATAGAEVRRGVTVRHLSPGETPNVTVEAGGKTSEIEARLVAMCAERNPAFRTELRFAVRRGSIPLLLSGVWLTNLPNEVDHSWPTWPTTSSLVRLRRCFRNLATGREPTSDSIPTPVRACRGIATSLDFVTCLMLRVVAPFPWVTLNQTGRWLHSSA
jgi:2-polyprenyl-6-methoxyphenol hydroxylase-like FAD-dependent oxidoreductase